MARLMLYQIQSLKTTLRVRVEKCYKADCAALVVLTEPHYERALQSHENFYCSVGHPQHYDGKTEQEKRHEAELQRLRGQAEQDRRLREEAERRAGRAEEERLKAEREKNSTKRALRNAVRTSAKLVSTKGRDRARSHHKKKPAGE